MKINITAKNFKVSDYLESVVQKKLDKLDKFFKGDPRADVTIATEAGKQIMETTIYHNGVFLRAKVESSDIYASIDGVVEKLERQIEKHKSKLIDKHQFGSLKDIIQSENYDEDEFIPSVVKTKRFAIKPMSIEEAVLQMQLLDHSFFVFSNAETEEVNVLYKRKDGNYGLIDPEYDWW